MKNITKSLIALFAVLAISCSSDDVEDRPVIIAGDAPVLTAPTTGGNYILSFENAANQADRFVWTSANYGQNVAINYTIEIDKEGNEFATPKSLGSVIGQNQLSVSVEALNGAVLSLDAEPFEANNYEVRIKASVNDTFEAMYSNVSKISVTAYTTSLPKMYVVGSFLAASGYGNNWTASSGAPLAASGFGKTDFQGYVYINDASAQFKFLPTNVDFAGDYGDTGPVDGSYSGTIEQEGEVNAGLPTPVAGYYLVDVNTKPEIMSYTLINTQWAVTGGATPNGWPDNGVQDHDMTYDPTEKVWKVTLALSVGQIKFRANDTWAINYGDQGADGVLDFNNDANIEVTTAGTYLIKLNLSDPRNYTYTLTLQ